MRTCQMEIHTNAVRYVDDEGATLAEVTFPGVGEGMVEIVRTFVDESLRGQGVAGELMRQVAQELEESGRKARPACSYAVRWFEQHPEMAHLLA